LLSTPARRAGASRIASCAKGTRKRPGWTRLETCVLLANMRLFPLAVVALALAACDGSKEAVSTPTQSSTPVPSSTSEIAKTAGCEKYDALKTAFPEASAVGFTKRESIKYLGQRGDAWPGRCAGWWTKYSLGSSEVDFNLTLYKTHEQALAALSEPAFGPVEKISNGALVRTHRGPAAVEGVSKRYAGVASVYRNVFSVTVSIADEPISLSAQLALHRRIHEGVLAVG